jgi:predicted membrane metal-binding protein
MIEYFTIVLLAGAVLYRSVGIGLVQIGIISALTSAFFFIYFLSRKGTLVAIVTGIVLLAGAWYMSLHTTSIPQDFFNQSAVTATVQSVDRRLDKTVLVVKEEKYKKLLQITLHTSSALLPGDTVVMKGVISRPQDFMTATGRMFPYQQYLQSKGIVGLINNPILVYATTGGFSLQRLATRMRFAMADIFSRYIAFPIDGIMAGVVVGYQGGIPAYVQDLFRTTGVLHVLVLSGENITLLAIFLSLVLRMIPFKIRNFFIIAAIILVVLISGSGVSAIRAGIMGIVALSAGLLRRGYVPLRALTVSLLFFFFYSPETIFVDPGFHLSVLGTIFMIVILPKIERLFHFLPEQYNLRQVIILALCVPLFMLPYTMYFSGLLPLASPFANILMMIMTSVLMLAGATMIVVSWVPPFAQTVGLLISWMGNLTLSILQLLNKLPQWNTPPLAWWGVVATYVLFFAMFFQKEIRQFWYDWQTRLRSAVVPPPNSSGPENQ